MVVLFWLSLTVGDDGRQTGCIISIRINSHGLLAVRWQYRWLPGNINIITTTSSKTEVVMQKSVVVANRSGAKLCGQLTGDVV